MQVSCVSQGYIRTENFLPLQCCDRVDICNVTQQVCTYVLQPAVRLDCGNVTAHLYGRAAAYNSQVSL